MPPETTLLWLRFRDSAGNQTPDVAEMYLQLSPTSRNQITVSRLVDYVYSMRR